MLVITRKVGQEIQVGDAIRIRVVRAGCHRVRIGIEAPREVAIGRPEQRKRTEGDATRRVSERAR